MKPLPYIAYSESGHSVKQPHQYYSTWSCTCDIVAYTSTLITDSPVLQPHSPQATTVGRLTVHVLVSREYCTVHGVC